MEDGTHEEVMVFECRGRRRCAEAKLVLDAAGIPARIVSRRGVRWLLVHPSEAEMAAAELEAYRRENAEAPAPVETPTVVYGGAGVATALYVAVIVVFAVVEAPWGLAIPLRPAGRMQASAVMDGQWWRTITALTLHADAGHLLANVVFGIVLGFPAGRVLGGGVAWLAIVSAASLGNFMNALARPVEHFSIGASTAVFAALGIVVAHALRSVRHGREAAFKRWSPLIAGIVLLGFTGIGGERTDVAAHVTGFIAGVIIGWIGCRIPDSLLKRRLVQQAAGLIAIAIVVIAWTIALAAATTAEPTGA